MEIFSYSERKPKFEIIMPTVTNLSQKTNLYKNQTLLTPSPKLLQNFPFFPKQAHIKTLSLDLPNIQNKNSSFSPSKPSQKPEKKTHFFADEKRFIDSLNSSNDFASNHYFPRNSRQKPKKDTYRVNTMTQYNEQLSPSYKNSF